jgi:hypothetical protein
LIATARSGGETVDSMTLLFLSLSLSLLFLLLAKCLKGLLNSPETNIEGGREREREREKEQMDRECVCVRERERERTDG